MRKPSLLAVAVAAVLAATPATAAPAATNVTGPRTPDGNDPFAAISADGRYVAYDAQSGPGCRGSLGTPFGAPSTADCVIQVYVHDLVTKKSELISRTPAGGPGNATSRRPTISADGRYVAFLSAATNLLPGGKAPEIPVYVHDRKTRRNVRVRLPKGTRTDEAGFYAPRLSPDGSVVVIDPGADLRTGKRVYTEGGPLYAVWWRTGRLVPVSVATSGALSTQSTYDYGVSRTGRYVAFSTSVALSPADTDDDKDVYVRDTTKGTTIPATATIPETCGPVDTVAGSCGTYYGGERLDDAGRTVAFTANGPPQGTQRSRYRVGVRDLVTGQARFKAMEEFTVETGLGVVSVPSAQEVALSGDGRHVYIVVGNEVTTGGFAGSLWHWDLTKDTVTRLTGGMAAGSQARNQIYDTPSASFDGRRLAVITTAQLAADDTDDLDDVYVLTG